MKAARTRIVFKNGTLTAKASGAAPRTNATVKIPAGFGAGTATIVLEAEMNPARTSTVTLSLGGSDKSGFTGKPKPKPKRRRSSAGGFPRRGQTIPLIAV